MLDLIIPSTTEGNYNPSPFVSVPAERLACHHSQRIGKTLTKMIPIVTKKKFFCIHSTLARK
jgi:hypothetical protein